MKKSVANEIAKHLKKVALNATDATSFVVNVYSGTDSYVELLPDYERRIKSCTSKRIALSAFHHIQEVADIERYHGVLSLISVQKATFEGEEYNTFRVQIF